MMEPGPIGAFAHPNLRPRAGDIHPILTNVVMPDILPQRPQRKEQVFFMGKPYHPGYNHFKKNRRYPGAEDSIPYPLPCDHDEINRQNIRHHVFSEVFGGLHAAEFPRREDIPSKVLDVGCGSGLWIASMADEFAARGRKDVAFTGLDIVKAHSEMSGVNFRFVRHNLLNMPLPFADGEFDYIMVREMTMCYPQDRNSEALMEQLLRILRVGGILEMQCSDPMIRCLAPLGVPPNFGSGAYPMSASTRFNQKSDNPFIQDWNRYINLFLSSRGLHSAPCTTVQSTLLMEARRLGNIKNRRYALPLDNPAWETEGAGGSSAPSTPSAENRSIYSVISSSGEARRSSDSSRSGSKVSLSASDITLANAIYTNKFLSDNAKALRVLARTTFTDMIRNLEPVLRRHTGISQEDWDWWFRDLMVNFHQKRGLTNGECLEMGAWWGVKRNAKD